MAGVSNQIVVADLLRELELPANALEEVLRAGCFADAERALRRLQAQGRRQRRRLAVRHHPDRGGDVGKMQAINAAADLLGKLRLQRPRPIMVYHVWSTGGATTASTTTYSGW